MPSATAAPVGTRQLDVEEHDRGPKGADGLDRLCPVRRFANYREPFRLEHRARGRPELVVIVDDQHGRPHGLIVASSGRVRRGSIAGRLADAGLRVAIVERELVGGECDYWACHPVEDALLRPGEALQAAREAPGAREAVSGGVRAEGAFEWRDFMVAEYEDGAKAASLEAKGIEVLRGTGRLAGPGKVEDSDGRAHGASHVVLATGVGPGVPARPRPGRAGGRSGRTGR